MILFRKPEPGSPAGPHVAASAAGFCALLGAASLLPLPNDEPPAPITTAPPPILSLPPPVAAPPLCLLVKVLDLGAIFGVGAAAAAFHAAALPGQTLGKKCGSKAG